LILNIKPTYEKISPSFGSSILVKQHSKSINNSGIAFWHFHPEIELVYVNKGKGKRHIGNHLSYFNNSQLILIGSNLPHYGFTDRFTASGTETIVQFKSDFLGKTFFDVLEMNTISTLFNKAKKGILFSPETKKIVGPKIESLLDLQGFNRIIKLLEVLNDLSKADDYTLLNVDGFAFETKPQDSAKIDIAFCRYFKKSTGKTFTKLVNEYRVVHATKLLLESQSSITDVCYESGFNNFSHFNKLFKEITGKSASKYRSEMKLMIQ